MIIDFIELIVEFFLWMTGKRSKRNSEWTGKVIEKKTKSDYSLIFSIVQIKQYPCDSVNKA